MKQFFKELLEYGHHYNQKLGTVFIENTDKTSEKSVELYSHILNAHHIWNNRVDQKTPAFNVWQIQPVSKFKDIDKINYEHSLRILENANLNETLNYSTSNGQPFSNTIQDIFFHIINHSTYHRGQIATEFKQNGLVPLVTDYIFYKR